LHYTTTGNPCCRGIVEFMPPGALTAHHAAIASGAVRLEDVATLQCVPLRDILRQVGVRGRVSLGPACVGALRCDGLDWWCDVVWCDVM
jgi:hypothetical protein